jgi:phosphoglycerate kinase
VLKALAAKVDALIVGGGIANTFVLAVHGHVGKSLVETDLVGEAGRSWKRFRARSRFRSTPSARRRFSASATPTLKAIEDIAADDMILDLGPTSVAALNLIVAKAGTIVWNGPLGVFEFAAFAAGTRALANAIATSSAFSIAGGGDTVAAIHKFGIAERISYISTAGGAFLEFLEGKTLPAVAILEARAAS